ncbi:MAG: hypothetical protein COB17_10665 [Sulfurimonas sp.]|nr:MAG: hypothetical protein COB17_10665 [Sulfurimonas sp.]
MKNNKLIKSFFLFASLFSLADADVLLFTKAYDLALLNAHEIKSSVYQSKSNVEKVNQEKSRLYPQVNLSGSYRKAKYQYSDSNREAISQSLFNGTLSVQQSIYNPEIYSKIDMETSRAKLYKTGIKLKKEELAQSVFEAYLNLLKSRNKIDLYKSYLQYSKTRLKELNKKYDLYLANKMDVLEMKVEYNSANIDLTKELKLNKVYGLKLNKLIGDFKYDLPDVNSDANILDSISAMKDTIKDDGEFSKNLKIAQAKIALKLSQDTINNAFDAHLPRIDFDVSASIYETSKPTLLDPYSDIVQARIVLNIPIYSGGMTSSRVIAAELMKKAAYEDLLNTKKEVMVEYDEKKAIFDASIESVSMYNDAFTSAKLYVDAIKQGYAHGLKSVTDLNDAKNKLYEVKYKYIENIYEMVNSYVGLLIVTNNFDNIALLDKLLE